MAGERYQHIFLPGPSLTQNFTNPRQGGGERRTPSRNREQHSTYLRERLNAAWEEVEDRQAVAHTERHGAYIDFVSEPGFELAVKSLESLRSGIRLLNVRVEGSGENEQTLATVYIPHQRRRNFLKKIQAYAEEMDRRARDPKPKNAALINSISDIRRSVLESFWRADERPLIPGEDAAWVEVWLSSDENEVVERFQALVRGRQVTLAEGELRFPERTVLMVSANRQQLDSLVEASDDIAEFRLAKGVTTFFIELENQEQLGLVRNLLERTHVADVADVAVCILDHGVNNGHLLIQPVLDDADLHAVRWEWGTSDDHGHGTLMAGTIAYGDLLQALGSGESVRIGHRLKSAKILPPPPERNPQDLWGYRTAQGLSLAEIQAPNRKRITCLAVTSTDFRDRGRPSSWSATIDERSSGYDDDIRRLFVVSAGNVTESEDWQNYPHANITNEVHDPGQAWNALTVGAYTEKDRIVDPSLEGYSPIAPAGGLSPYSTTSSTWPTRKWPIKPDVVFEGGNVARGPNDSIFEADDLKPLSTFRDPQIAQFAPFGGTSAAAALATRMAAQIQSQYPQAWPETVRALMVHSAEWTQMMRDQFLPNSQSPSKGDCANLLRICGYGVPNLESALYCAANTLTLISEAELQPYDLREQTRGGRTRVTRDMHLYDLPWPTDILQDLGETLVRMRVTLSYFIEPGPGEIGWQDRYRYPSHLLRFVVNGPGETQEEFSRRVNTQVRDEEEGHPGTAGPGDRWLVGEARNVGSIHSDTWQGTASELAASNLIGVYPAVGWWRERHHLGRVTRRCRYSLIVSIQPPSVEVDIYTPVAAQVGIAVPIEVSIS